MFIAKAKLDRIEYDLRAIDGQISSINGRLSHIEGMARLALWVVPAMVGLITAVGTIMTVVLSRH